MRRSKLILLPFLLLLGGAERCDRPSRPETDTIVRWWKFTGTSRNGGTNAVEPEASQVGGAVSAEHGFGPMLLFPPEVEQDARAEVFSSEDGFTYWASTQAPPALAPVASATVGSGAELAQVQMFRKTDPRALLTYKITRSFLDAIDDNGGLPSAVECPWRKQQPISVCRRVMDAWVDVTIVGQSSPGDVIFFTTGGTAELTGWMGNFDYEVHSGRGRRFWTRDSFDFDPDVTDTGGTRAQLYLAQPITVVVPLDSIAVGQEFMVTSWVEVGAFNMRQRESYLAAAFRDPVDADGVELSYTGLTPLETPRDRPERRPSLEPAAACAGAADPQAGTLELVAGDLAHPELPGLGAPVVVQRSGGTRGRVSARLVSSGGSATAGADYAAVDTVVVFEDGQDGTQTVRVPMVVDDTVEPDETVTLTLSDARGCATLGALRTATLTIQDDDEAIQLPPTFTVGGTVSGLHGSGLVLREVRSGFDLSPTGDGPFTFSYQHPDHQEYEVRVVTQPHDPFQVCTVARGSGTIAGADVTDVAVTCEDVAQNGALDPSFGEAGKVAGGGLSDIVALVLQPDGKIVAVGKQTVTRLLADGTRDPGFGSGGAVTVSFGNQIEQLNAVALQPDGKIVVAGQSRSLTTSDDFSVARLNADGSFDGSFASGGKVTTDFNGLADRAWGVMVAADGSIVAAGHAARPTALGGDNDFAAVRYSAGGVLDGVFGKVLVDIAGATDLANAAALQPDGKIVIAGRVAPGGGDDPDVGLVRLLPTGQPDPDFGTAGVVRRAVIAGWDEASDVAIAPDGKMVVAVKAQNGASFELAVARFNADGTPDGGFGSAGFVSTPFSGMNDFATGVALDAGGRVIVVGQRSNSMLPDFAVARFTAAGALDASFADGGKLAVDFFGSNDGAECVAVQPDGKIVVGGVARSGSTVGGAMVRVLP